MRQKHQEEKAVVLDLRTSLAAQLCFLVLQEDPGPSHPLTGSEQSIQSRLVPLPVQSSAEGLRQHGSSLESNRPQ